MIFRHRKNKIKYRAISIALLMLLIMTSLTGCAEIKSLLDFDKPDNSEGIKIHVDESITPDIIIVEKVEELDDSEAADISELPEKDLAIASQELVSADGGRKYYAYEQLNPEEKALYTEIYGILSTLAKDTKVSSKDPDQIEKAFNYVMLDHPELFYLTGYSFTKYMRGSSIEKITVSGTYTMTANEVVDAMHAVDAYVDKCIAGYDGPVDEYEKVKYVYEYLIRNTEYDLEAPNNQNILSITMEGRTVCQGYAKATQYILNKMGVFCILCEGIVKGTESHVWNIVRINGNYYHVDATWGDASYMIGNNTGDFKAPEINYDYLCIPDNTIKETHVIKDNINHPICDSMQDNYYVREGLYLTELDTEIIMNAFDTARAKGETIVTLKCADANVYAALFNHLIDNHGIFDYLNGSKTVNYVEFRDECRISFYI